MLRHLQPTALLAAIACLGCTPTADDTERSQLAQKFAPDVGLPPNTAVTQGIVLSVANKNANSVTTYANDGGGYTYFGSVGVCGGPAAIASRDILTDVFVTCPGELMVVNRWGVANPGAQGSGPATDVTVAPDGTVVIAGLEPQRIALVRDQPWTSVAHVLIPSGQPTRVAAGGTRRSPVVYIGTDSGRIYRYEVRSGSGAVSELASLGAQIDGMRAVEYPGIPGYEILYVAGHAGNDNRLYEIFTSGCTSQCSVGVHGLTARPGDLVYDADGVVNHGRFGTWVGFPSLNVVGEQPYGNGVRAAARPAGMVGVGLGPNPAQNNPNYFVASPNDDTVRGYWFDNNQSVTLTQTTGAYPWDVSARYGTLLRPESDRPRVGVPTLDEEVTATLDLKNESVDVVTVIESFTVDDEGANALGASSDCVGEDIEPGASCSVNLSCSLSADDLDGLDSLVGAVHVSVRRSDGITETLTFVVECALDPS